MKKLELKPLYIVVLCLIFQSTLYLTSKSLQGTPTLIGNTIDTKIPFIIYFIIPYVIWYLLIILIPYFYYKKDKEVFKKYIISYLFMSIIANTIFILWPTTVTRPQITQNSILYSLTNLIYTIDTPAINCFPSLHCAVSFIWILYILKLKDTNIFIKLLVIFTALLIIISTLCIKQHVFIDMISGITLSIVVYFIVRIYFKYKR
ncbi:MAG: phosphatase PAP2 family protein [Tenericutes bacterium]|nr:phosphatase PAP2 family protein [Mycoplasmatota bacterium]